MLKRLLFLVVTLGSLVSVSEDKPCESKCNLEGSDCLKSCSQTKETAGDAKLMMHCLKHCEVKTKACKETCQK
jgi:hypothetical protein